MIRKVLLYVILEWEPLFTNFCCTCLGYLQRFKSLAEVSLHKENSQQILSSRSKYLAFYWTPWQDGIYSCCISKYIMFPSCLYAPYTSFVHSLIETLNLATVTTYIDIALGTVSPINFSSRHCRTSSEPHQTK